MQEKGQEALLEKLTKNVGFGIGLEFRESFCLLNAKNANLVKAGMAFNVAVGRLIHCYCHVNVSQLKEYISLLRVLISSLPAECLAFGTVQVWLT